MSWQQPPQNQPPYGYQPPVRQRSDMPTYNITPPQPVIVNVIQNAYAPRPYVVVRRVNHRMHFWLTFLTGGLWAPIWIHAARKHKRVYYVR